MACPWLLHYPQGPAFSTLARPSTTLTADPQLTPSVPTALGEHTDFGTLTLLHNRLGGLQILPPPHLTQNPKTPNSTSSSRPQWHYVRPLNHHIIVNLGDALVKFTSGLLRSNLHRVVDPPGQQRGHERYSLVYFARPEDEVVLKAVQGSSAIDDAVREKNGERKGGAGGGGGGVGKGDGEEEAITAKEWILRRALGRRAGGDWAGSGGTEGDRV